MSEERDDEETEFEHLDTIEYNGNEYVVLLPVEQTEEENDAEEVVILN